ncbi:hypothetical protein GJU39_02950 [Pedobacter petrophilus]|uniref:Uncharacterized protein n=1 Tax=Pedobacter petrophilus TaxID=1908241 RepID=A0A7K0FVD1_9SPHI|nr:hypothetical protein [Pedobacter petrophilus]MRX75034.1 hypothetical protein [Pedobacter petrophilus]
MRTILWQIVMPVIQRVAKIPGLQGAVFLINLPPFGSLFINGLFSITCRSFAGTLNDKLFMSVVEMTSCISSLVFQLQCMLIS